MCLSGIELAPFARVNDACCIRERRWPLEALAEGVPDQRLGSSVMPAHASMYVSQERLALLDGNASLQDPSDAALIKLTVDDDEGFGAACGAPGFRLIRWKLLMYEPVEVDLAPVGGRGRFYRLLAIRDG